MIQQTTDQRVAAEVRGQLARHGLRQGEAAQILGISQPSLSRKVNGLRSFTVDELHILARHLGISPTVLLDPPARPHRCSRALGGRGLAVPPL